MSSENFTISKKALITLIAASIVVIISLGIRQTFGLFYFDFNTDLDISISHFGFAMGLQLLLWGVFSPLFGVITDKYGGAVAIFIGFVFYLVGVLFFYSGFNTGSYFTLTIGVMIGIGLGSTAIGIPVSVVAKHFPASNRTIATGIVTCAGSFGYFVSPLLVRYSLVIMPTKISIMSPLGVGVVADHNSPSSPGMFKNLANTFCFTSNFT